MDFNRFASPSISKFLIISFLYLLILCRKCNTRLAAASSSSSFSSSSSSHAIRNITVNMSDEQRLFHTLMMGYEKAVRPTRRAADAVVVKLGITLTQIMDIVSRERKSLEWFLRVLSLKDERNQIMTTNIWLDQVRSTDSSPQSNRNSVSIQGMDGWLS